MHFQFYCNRRRATVFFLVCWLNERMELSSYMAKWVESGCGRQKVYILWTAIRWRYRMISISMALKNTGTYECMENWEASGEIEHIWQSAFASVCIVTWTCYDILKIELRMKHAFFVLDSCIIQQINWAGSNCHYPYYIRYESGKNLRNGQFLKENTERSVLISAFQWIGEENLISDSCGPVAWSFNDDEGFKQYYKSQLETLRYNALKNMCRSIDQTAQLSSIAKVTNGAHDNTRLSWRWTIIITQYINAANEMKYTSKYFCGDTQEHNAFRLSCLTRTRNSWTRSAITCHHWYTNTCIYEWPNIKTSTTHHNILVYQISNGGWSQLWCIGLENSKSAL